MPRARERAVVAVGLLKQKEPEHAPDEYGNRLHKATLDTRSERCNLEPVDQARSCNLTLSTRKQKAKYKFRGRKKGDNWTILGVLPRIGSGSERWAAAFKSFQIPSLECSKFRSVLVP